MLAHMETQNKIYNILTPEQKDKLDKIKAEHKKKFEEGRKNRKMMKKHKGPRPGPEPRD